jgi:CRISPR-associated protein Cmr4
MESKLYIISAITNLHVGSGDSDFGMIGKQIQRDPLDNLPCINSSSLKGAFREHLEENLNEKDKADYIFGFGVNKTDADEKEQEKRDEGKVKNAKGAYIFHEGFVLSVPIRSNYEAYFNATCPSVIKQLLDNIDLFDISISEVEKTALLDFSKIAVNNTKPKVFINQKEVIVEDYTAEYQAFTTINLIEKWIGARPILLSDADFEDLTSDYQLPLIARNNLENGQSKNLWYEQIMPRQSKFYTMITATKAGDTSFYDLIKDQNVQIGANATIGYGLCKIKEITA